MSLSAAEIHLIKREGIERAAEVLHIQPDVLVRSLKILPKGSL